MLDSVGIRLPKYKVREMTISMKDNGELTGDVIDKMMFVQVNINSFCILVTLDVCSLAYIYTQLLRIVNRTYSTGAMSVYGVQKIFHIPLEIS